ncbi:MAG: prolyl oligopeptidase family serine peptidase [Candidatus Sumerlaeota bacterium]|nr:prolyl oligopeptidase family serine peptidase [Candidatus Sumerlaeota bacterium]
MALLFAANVRADETPTRREWKVDGVVREALVCAPSKATTEGAPVVFAFHGHGGSMANAARMFGYHKQWPEAIVVYPQGLNTPGRLTDPEGKKPGWQSRIGDQGDRDLKFFDAMLESLKKDYRVDEKRIYATGHSNGGGFTYLLWAARGDKFAAFAPSAAVFAPGAAAAAETGIGTTGLLKPKPVMHLAGEKDPLVKYEWQKRMIEALQKFNQCGESQPWDKGCTLYPSKAGAPVVTFIHPGAHQFVPEAPALIVKFFKEHVKP